MVSKTIIDKEKDTDAAVTNAAATGGNSWDLTPIHDAIPWPCVTFVIVEKASGCCQHDKHKRMMNWGRLSYLLTWYALKDLSELLAFASGHSHIINPTSPSPTSPRLRG
jgi:hypothetical protein